MVKVRTAEELIEMINTEEPIEFCICANPIKWTVNIMITEDDKVSIYSESSDTEVRVTQDELMSDSCAERTNINMWIRNNILYRY